MNRTMISRSALLAVALMLVPSILFPYSDQTTTERILKENKDFVEFINISVTNFAEAKKEDFRKIYEKHFNADIAYLQSDYKRAFKRVYSSQGEMEKLYRDMVKEYYLEDSKSILDRLAPGIIRSKSPRARLYLTLGYRDRTVSWVHYTVGDASNPKLYSYKLYKYVDAIKMARRAKRYAFLALFESQTIDMKKKIYNQLCKTERDMGSRYMGRFIDLGEQDYINELAKNYDESRKAEESGGGASGRKDGGGTSPVKPADATFEKKVEKRVRFRNETKTARYLMNGEFDQAEDIMRQYVDDFNFKIIYATFDVLAISGKPAAEDRKTEGKTDRFDFSNFKLHLADNYTRLVGTSIMDGIIDSVKVEDDVTMKGGEPKGDKGAAVPDKKESAEPKKEEGKIQ